MVERPVDFDFQGMAIFGAPGNIGTRLIEKVTTEEYPAGEHILNSDLKEGQNPFPHAHPTKIIAISDSKRFYVDIAGIPAELLRATAEADTEETVRRLLEEAGTEHGGHSGAMVDEINQQIANATTPAVTQSNIGYIDLSDNQALEPTYDKVIQETRSTLVVVSKAVLGRLNKDQFRELIDSGRIEFSGTVGAGMEAAAYCLKKAESAHPVTSIDAMISGTNLAICRELDSEAYRHGEIEFSDILEKLWKRGDTEPHAHKDVGEFDTDTQDKIRILLMSADYEAKIEDINTQAINDNNEIPVALVPQSFRERFPGGKESMPAYLAAIKAEYDSVIREYVEKNVDDEHTIRHIARFRRDENGVEKVTVGLERVKRDSEFGRADRNFVEIKNDIETRTYLKEGAGRDVTAEAIQDAFKGFVPKDLPRRAA